MRIAVVILGCLGLAGCGDRHQGAVAHVDGRTLSVDRLAELMVLAQPVPLTREVAQELATHWVQWTAFAARMAAGDSLLDSAAVLQVMWHPVRQEIVAQWRQRLLARAGVRGDERRTARFDSVYAGQLLRDRGARVREGAAAVVRRIAGDPWSPLAAPETLATFAGGAVAAGDLARHVQYLSPSTRREMLEASDERIAEFLSGLVLQELLLAQADSAGVRLSAGAFRVIAGQCRDAVHALWRDSNLSPASLASVGPERGDREQAATRRVEEYLDAAAARRVPLEPLPPFLAVALLRTVEWEIVPKQLEAVVERAQRLLAGTRR